VINKRLLTLVSYTCIALLLIATLLMAACATAPTPAQTAVLSPTQTQAKAIELRFADWNPPESLVGQLNQKMADMICERSGGRLRIKIYPAESLANMNEVATAIRTGVADMAYWAILTPGAEVANKKVFAVRAENVCHLMRSINFVFSKG
jgi:TRAP-type C4-dicarboxylate transport system substrate-binding protein